jgi:ATP-dependent exoDNAse (exonuclease V) alpha subunit
VALDGGRRVSFDSTRFRHLDHGYAVTSYSSQGQTVDRVIVNADTKESEVLLNQRMGYVAVSRAREDALIYTNSKDELGAALDREVDKQMGLEAVRQTTRSELHAGAHDVAKPPDRGHEVNANSHSIGVGW